MWPSSWHPCLQPFCTMVSWWGLAFSKDDAWVELWGSETFNITSSISGASPGFPFTGKETVPRKLIAERIPGQPQLTSWMLLCMCCSECFTGIASFDLQSNSVFPIKASFCGWGNGGTRKEVVEGGYKAANLTWELEGTTTTYYSPVK